MTNRQLMLLTAVCLAGCLRPALNQVPVLPAGDITVAADGSGDHLTIGAAVAAAKDGDVIVLKPGEYRESVKIVDKRRLTIVGGDPAKTVVDAAGFYAAVEIRTDSNRVSGLTLRNADDHGVWVRDGNQVIDRCLVLGCGDRGIYLSALAGFAFARIEFCTVAENGASGVYAARDDARTVIRHSIIAHNPQGIVTDDNAGEMVVEGNCLFNAGGDFDRVTPGPGNILQDPLFNSREMGDYRVAQNSPCASSGPEGTYIGCLPPVRRPKRL